MFYCDTTSAVDWVLNVESVTNNSSAHKKCIHQATHIMTWIPWSLLYDLLVSALDGTFSLVEPQGITMAIT